MEGEELAVVVLDSGCGTTKCGFAGDDAPRSIFRSMIGKPRIPGIMVGKDERNAFIGKDALERRGLLTMSLPL
jgi:actin-related protein